MEHDEVIERRATDPVLMEHIKKEELHDQVQDQRLQKIEDRLSAMDSSLKGLLDAWNAANTIGNFLKWVAGVSAGALIVWEALKHLGNK